jgi:hypothetical protein
VDDRRAGAGLGRLSEYLELMREFRQESRSG